MQQLPSPGQKASVSISSQNITKNPFKHSPEQGFCFRTDGFEGNGVFKLSVVVMGLNVVVVVVVIVDDDCVTLVKLLFLFGMITLEGIFSSLESREMQHFCPSGHKPSGFKIA